MTDTNIVELVDSLHCPLECTNRSFRQALPLYKVAISALSVSCAQAESIV